MPKFTGLNEVNRNSMRMQIAQGPSGVSTDQAVSASHASVKTDVQPGDIPSAGLLFANSVLIALLLVIFALAAGRKLQRIPRGMQNLVEFAVGGLDNFVKSTIGPSGGKYTPLVGTLFLYILLMNVVGLIPGFHSPTSNVTITFALGLVVFVYVQYEGIRAQGVLGHLKHFAGPVLAISPLLFVIELVSEIVKPFTLAIRLFGNIFGEDVVLVILAGLGATLFGTAWGWIPFHLLFYPLMLMTDVVQALVFAILTCIYLALVTEKHDHGEHDAAHAEGH